MKNYQTEIKWGIIFTIVGLLWMVFEKAMGWHDELIEKHPLYTNLFGIIAILIYFLALRDKRENFFNGIMSWRQGFISGIIVTIVITLFTPLSQYLVYQYISPDYFTNIIEYSVGNDRLNRKDADALFNLKSYIIQSTSWALVMGVVTAAIVAWILKVDSTEVPSAPTNK